MGERTMTTAKILDLLDDCSSALVVTHTQADFDGLGAGVALVETFDGEAALVVPEGVEKRALGLLDRVSVSPVAPTDVSLAEYDAAVVVDAPSNERVAPVDVVGADVRVIVIDHHSPANLAEQADAAFIDTEAGATAELVYRLGEDAGWSLTPESALALVTGILDDTGHLRGGSPAQFRMVADLLERAGPYRSDVAAVLDPTQRFGERMARAKAAVRADGYRADRFLVLTTAVGGHETAAAHTLLGADADLALVFSERDDETRVIARLADRRELHLPDQVLDPLAQQFGGHAGGHTGAGVAKLETEDVDAVRDRTLDLVEEIVGETLSPLR